MKGYKSAAQIIRENVGKGDELYFFRLPKRPIAEAEPYKTCTVPEQIDGKTIKTSISAPAKLGKK